MNGENAVYDMLGETKFVRTGSGRIFCLLNHPVMMSDSEATLLMHRELYIAVMHGLKFLHFIQDDKVCYDVD
jgi:hypothetical protein